MTDKLSEAISQPSDIEKRFVQASKSLNTFKDKLLGKFEGYIAGVGLLPVGRSLDELNEFEDPSQKKQVNPNDLNVIVLIDDTDSQKMTKMELKEKLQSVILNMAAEVDTNIKPQVLIYSELWQYCFDAKTEILQLIASLSFVYDNGMLAAIKVTEVHKAMVLKKFEKYIVSYVLAGSLVQGKATPTSDVDVFIVIDDTDVKKMTRAELKDRLRSIIIGMSMQAGEMTGVTNKLNIQCYILTDFWESIKEANPVIFTFLRDGVPFYDRGIFMPWKQLLRMGKIRPSMESIDLYMSLGEQTLERTKFKLNEIGMEDTYWAILYPSQAALMLYGLAPPTPRETPELLRKIFVKKEKILEEKFVKILEHNIQLRKELEHGTKKKATGEEIDKCINDAQSYLDRIRKLFDDIQQKQVKQSLEQTYDHVVSVVRDILKIEGVSSVPEAKIESLFTKHLIETGRLPQKVLRSFEFLVKAKKELTDGTLNKNEIEKVRIQSQELVRDLIEYVQRKRAIELERTKVRMRYGKKTAEVMVLDKVVYIVPDSEAETRKLLKAPFDGKIGKPKETTFEDLDAYIQDLKFPINSRVTKQILTDLAVILGDDVEVLLN